MEEKAYQANPPVLSQDGRLLFVPWTDGESVWGRGAAWLARERECIRSCKGFAARARSLGWRAARWTTHKSNESTHL